MSSNKDETAVHGCFSYLHYSYSGEASYAYACKGRHTRGSLLLKHAPATCSRSKAPSSVPTISCEKIVAQQNYCSRVLLHWIKLVKYEGTSSRSKSVAGACCRSKLPRVYRPLGNSNIFLWNTTLLHIYELKFSTFVTFAADFRSLLKQWWRATRRSSISSAHVSAEIPIHIPILPPMSDKKLSICKKKVEQNMDWVSQLLHV